MNVYICIDINLSYKNQSVGRGVSRLWWFAVAEALASNTLCRGNAFCCCDTTEKWGGKNHWTTSNALSNSWASAAACPHPSETPRDIVHWLGILATVAALWPFICIFFTCIYFRYFPVPSPLPSPVPLAKCFFIILRDSLGFSANILYM